MRRAAALLTAATLLLAGCGGGGGSSDTPEAAVRTYINAFVSGDGAKACSLMTPSTRRQFVRGSRRVTHTSDCATAVDRIRNRAAPGVLDALKKSKISDVKVNGDRATASVSSATGSSVTHLRKQGGSWHIAGAPGTQ
jgi:hypothetical protein